jgi:hypothetical protein
MGLYGIILGRVDHKRVEIIGGRMKDKSFSEEYHVCPKTGKIIGKKKPQPQKTFLMFPVVGFFALVWFLIRVIPKPKRMTYPCQQIAAPIAWNFISGSFVFLGLTAIFKKVKSSIRSKPLLITVTLISVLTLAAMFNITFLNVQSLAEDKIQADSSSLSISKANSPKGIGRGMFPGRVVWVHDKTSTSWDGVYGYWWEDENTDQRVVDKMISKNLLALTAQKSDKNAWEQIFKYYNKSHNGKNSGYKKGEKIAIKINMNGINNYTANNACFTSPQIVYSLLIQLVTNAGVNPADITVYDASRTIPDCIFDRCNVKTLKGVKFADFSGGKGREVCIRDSKSTIHWSVDVKGNPAYLPTCVTSAKYMINIASLKGHNLTGISLTAKNHFGTIMTDLNGKPTINPPQGANLHGFVAAHDYGWGDPNWTWSRRPMGTYNPLVDLMGHKDLGGKTILYILDALYSSKDQSTEINSGCRWKSQPFNNDWPSSIFTSMDEVAIDSVGLDFIQNEPLYNENSDVLPENNTSSNYLFEASQANNPPSKTFYDPEGDGSKLGSLGVFEHWNNAKDKKYSRNLGTGKGIELIAR